MTKSKKTVHVQRQERLWTRSKPPIERPYRPGVQIWLLYSPPPSLLYIDWIWRLLTVTERHFVRGLNFRSTFFSHNVKLIAESSSCSNSQWGVVSDCRGKLILFENNVVADQSAFLFLIRRVTGKKLRIWPKKENNFGNKFGRLDLSPLLLTPVLRRRPARRATTLLNADLPQVLLH